MQTISSFSGKERDAESGLDYFGARYYGSMMGRFMSPEIIRPTPAGNVPKREQDAARDIEKATGVKPNLVPVRPLPQQ